jgi:putative oxidoreductase
MSKLLSTNYTAVSFNIAMFILRVGGGVILFGAHGYDKLIKFQQYSGKFMNFLGLGSTTSFVLVVFAEFFCSLLIILGLFTRLAVIPIIIGMTVALFQAHNGDIFGKGELSALFLIIFTTILLVGPGKFSVDGMISK